MAEKKIINKRQGPDAVIKIINTFSVLSWMLILIVFFVFSMAKPRVRVFEKGMNLYGGAWDESLLSAVLYLMILQFMMSIVGLLVNSTRNRRKTDTLNKGLISSGVLATLGIFLYAVLV